MRDLKTLTVNGVTYKATNTVPTDSVTLLASDWKGDGEVYSQVVEVPGVTAHTKIDLQPTSEQLAEFHYKILAFVAENEGGIVTVYSIGDKPDGDHTIQITKTEVEGTGKIRGNTVGTTMPRPDWNQTDPTKADYIKNKPGYSVTPEMFGAVGGGADDYAALQECIDYAKTNKKTVIFTTDYTTSKSIIIDGDDAFSTSVFLDGNNRRLTVSNNVPALIVRGNGNRVENLTITYTSDWYLHYSASLVQLQSMVANDDTSCDRNSFINVTCRCSEEWREHILYNSIGFEFVLLGSDGRYAHAYDNKFVSCYCRNIGTAIKITTNEYSSGCNGNLFDVSGWAVDCYLDGDTGKCTFEGLVQPEELKKDDSGNILNEYIFKNMGQYNLINCCVYDYNGSAGIINRPLIVDGVGKYNHFTQPINTEGVKNNIYNIFNVVSNSCGQIMLPFSPFISRMYAPMYTYLPFRNSFETIEEATLTVENVSLANGYYTSSEKYPNVESGMPTNVAAVFHDDSNGRKLGFFKNTGAGDGFINIEFVPSGVIDAMFIYFSHWENGTPSGVQLIREYSDGTVATEDMVHTIGTGGSFAHYLGYAADRTQNPTKATIRITTNGTSNMFISQICGYMHNREDGII